MWSRADSLLMACLLSCSLLASVYLATHLQQASRVEVFRHAKLVRSIDLNKPATYTIKGDLGLVYLRVKEGKIAVTKETSGRHLCSQQGYVNQVPIVCLPNGIYVKPVGGQDVDTLIQ